jgi:hypothetical protein
MDRKRQPSNYPVTPAALSQSRFLNPASALLPQNVAHDRAMSRRLDHAVNVAAGRRAGRSVGPALIGWLHLGLSLGSFRSIACHYAGLRGEGSTPVPLPPPYCPRPRILQVKSRAIRPSNSNDFSFELRTPDLESRLIFLRTARFSPKLWTPSIRYGSRNLNVWSYL